jgi:hypothetical protein
MGDVTSATPDNRLATATEPSDRWRPVEFYRLDMSRRMLAVMLLCPLPTLLGVLLLMPAMQGKVEATPEAIALGVVGLLCVVAGPLTMLLSLKHVFESDDYLLLRTDGLLEHVRGQVTLYPWDDLEAVTFDASTGTIVMRRRDGGEARLTHRCVDIDARALAKRLDEVRRKAIWALL